MLDTHVRLTHIADMSEPLDAWMDAEGISVGDLAKQVNRDRTRVLRWRNKKGRPDFEALAKLEEISGGRVNLQSFLAGASQ